MSNVKVGDWVVNVSDKDIQLTIGQSYEVVEKMAIGVKITDDKGRYNFITRNHYKLTPQKYRNPPREKYRELCEAWLAGADINYIRSDGNEFDWDIIFPFSDSYNYRIDPKSVLPQPDERKEHIKKQLLNIDADKLAQLIIDSGIEL